MLGKGVVATVVGRHCHDGAGAIACQYILGNPNGDGFAGEWVDGIRAGEDTGHLSVGHAVKLGTLLHVVKIFIHFGLLFGLGDLRDIVGLGGEHHECHAKHGVGTRGEDGDVKVGILDFELHLGTFRPSNPVFLGLGDRVAPVDAVQAVEQSLGVCRHTETPLAHLLLHHGKSSSYRHAVDNLVVGQHGTQSGTPVDHRLALVGNAIVHQHAALLSLAHGIPFLGGECHGVIGLCDVQALGSRMLEIADESVDGQGLILVFVKIRIEHPHKGPLCPVIISGVAGANLAVPVETKSDFIQLLAIMIDVFFGGDRRMLAGLNGILLGRQSVGIVAHRVENIKSFQAFVACKNITGYISERVSHMKSGTGRIREHVQNIIFWAVGIFDNFVGFPLYPERLPFFLDITEFVFHYFILLIILPLNIDNCKVSVKKQKAQRKTQKRKYEYLFALGILQSA